MPLIHVTATRNTLNKQDQATLMTQVANAVLKAEGAPVDHEGAQSLTWAYFDEKPQDATYIGGQNLSQPPIIVAVTTPEGALNTDSRQSLVAEVGEIVDSLIGPFEGRLNHWTMLHEVKEGSWAGGGQVFPLAAIKDAMNIKG